MKKTLLAILLLACIAPAAVVAQEQPPPPGPEEQSPPPPPPKRMFFGGGIGFGVGDVDWVDVSPVVGVRLIPDLATGIGVTYRYTKDSRYEPDLTTSDFGASVFAQYTLFGNIFAMAEYEYLNYEYYDAYMRKTSDTYDSVLVGGGAYQPLGGHAQLVFSALYNLSYSEDEPGPYGSPWVFSAGVSVGF